MCTTLTCDSIRAGGVCGKGGRFPFGSSALELDFPGAQVTHWAVGSRQWVAWQVSANHLGGYTYRLCRLTAAGKAGVSEECFQQAGNALEWADTTSKVRDMRKPGQGVEIWTDLQQEDIWAGGAWWRHTPSKVSFSHIHSLQPRSILIQSSLQPDKMMDFCVC